MAFQLGDDVFVDADARTKFSPGSGPKKGQPFAMLAAKSCSMDHNGKAVSMVGNSILPVAVELVSAEPSFTFGLDVLQVSIDLAEHAGPGYARMKWTISTTLNRPGIAPVTFIAEGCVIEKGFGFKMGGGAQPTDELSGKCRRIRMKYKGKIYDPFALPGSLDLT